MKLDDVHPARRLFVVGGIIAPYFFIPCLAAAALTSIPSVSEAVTPLLPEGLVPQDVSTSTAFVVLGGAVLLSTYFFRGLDRLAAKIFKEA